MNDTRLTATDEMLLASSVRLGSTRIVQFLWSFPQVVSDAALSSLWQEIDRTRLSRAPRRCFASSRRAWTASTNGERLRVTDAPEPEHDAAQRRSDWADEQVQQPLPENSGALWRLSALRDSSGTLVSLVVPHFRSDGHGLFSALAERGNPGPGSVPPRWREDLQSACTDVLAGIAGAGRWFSETALRRPGQDPGREDRAPLPEPLPGIADPDEPHFFTTVWFEITSTEWDDQARRHGASPNSLFVEVAANLVRSLPDRDEIIVGVPVSERQGTPDRRANALIVIPVASPGGSPRHTQAEAAPGRDRLRAALRTADRRRITVPPEPLWHLLPRSLQGRFLTGGAQQTDVVASNFGQVANPPLQIEGIAASRTAVRSMNVPGVVPTRSRLVASLTLITDGATHWLTATALPDLFGDRDELAALLHKELAAWDVQAARWL